MFGLLGSVVTSFDILWSEVFNPSTLAATLPFNALHKPVEPFGIDKSFHVMDKLIKSVA